MVFITGSELGGRWNEVFVFDSARVTALVALSELQLGLGLRRMGGLSLEEQEGEYCCVFILSAVFSCVVCMGS